MHPESRPRGSNHANAKLSEDDVKYMRLLYDNGKTLKSIAGLYKITSQNVKSVVARKTWRHVA